MQLTFIYSDALNLHPLNKYDLRKVIISIPDVESPPETLKASLIQFAEAVSKLSQMIVYISCLPVNLREYPIAVDRQPDVSLNNCEGCMVLRFKRPYGKTKQTRDLVIPGAIFPPGPRNYPTRRASYKAGQRFRHTIGMKAQRFSAKTLNSLDMNLVPQFDWHGQTEDQKVFVAKIKAVADQYLELINTEQTPAYIGLWTFDGFQPSWKDETAIKAQKLWDREQAKLNNG